MNTADIDMMYLSNKRVLLANPGLKIDTLYYSVLNTTVDMSECTYATGRYIQSLSQLNFGSQSTVIIPNQSLLSTCYLHLVLPAIQASETICRGWGYGLINQIVFLFGSSNVSQVQISGQTMAQIIFNECGDETKRSEMFRLGGEEWITSSPGIITADILVPLPWSSACGGMNNEKLPFDTSLLNNPITIQIQFNPASSVYGGSATHPTGFQNALFIPRQGELLNRAQSLQTRLMNRPDLMYAYPWILKQTFPSAPFTGTVAPSLPSSFTLQSIINGDLIALSIGVVQTQYLSPTGTNSPSPFNYDPISNITLKWNGLVMFFSPGQLYKLVSMNSSPGPSYFHNSVINSATTGAYTSVPVDTYMLNIDFSRIHAVCYEGKYQNVWRIANNVLTIEFNTSTTNQYTSFITYYYNAVAEIQAGQTMIYYD